MAKILPKLNPVNNCMTFKCMTFKINGFTWREKEGKKDAGLK